MIGKCACVQDTATKMSRQVYSENHICPVLIADCPASSAMLGRLKNSSVPSVVAEARQLSIHALREQKARAPDVNEFSVSTGTAG